MIRLSKYSISSRIVFTSILLPLTIQGCSGFGKLFGGDDDYIDYTTDHLKPAAAAAAPPAVPGLQFRGRNQLEFDFYASAGLGISQLNPDTSDVAEFGVSDKVANGGQFTLGFDVNKHLSLEFHSADLGSAGLSPFGRINYHLNALSAVYYLGKNRQNYGRRGFTGFARAGMAMLENSTTGSISYDRINDTQVLFGAGLEYNTRSGVGFRAEAVAFDTDAQYAQVGLMYRFGKQKPAPKLALAEPSSLPMVTLTEQTPVVTLSELAPATLSAPSVIAEPMLAAALPQNLSDTDGDGVGNTVDHCADTLAYVTVDNNGCPLFSGTLEGVNFHTGSSTLTDTATYILNGVSHTLTQYPNSHILVAAHTDNNGNSEDNQTLSIERARAVVNFLAHKGIPYSQMSARAYGERKPANTNIHAEGRASNRRVELFATNRQVQQ